MRRSPVQTFGVGWLALVGTGWWCLLRFHMPRLCSGLLVLAGLFGGRWLVVMHVLGASLSQVKAKRSEAMLVQGAGTCWKLVSFPARSSGLSFSSMTITYTLDMSC